MTAAPNQQQKFILGTVGELKECRPSPESVTDLWASSGLFLRPVTKVSITVTIPFVKGKEGSRVVSNNEVIANIKKLVTPREFLTLKISKETNTFLRYIGEVEEKKDLPIFVSKLNGSFIQLKSFGTDAVFKLNAAEYDVIVPKQKDWVNHFAKMIGSDEDKPGMRPDTLLITGLPCAWFSNYHKDKQRTLKEFERKLQDKKKRRMIRNRRRQRGSSVSSSSGDEEGFGSTSTDSGEEEDRRKREQQKKILLQFQTGDYQNTEEGKSFVHTKDEIHKILRVDPKDAAKNKRRGKSDSRRRSRSSRSYSSRSDSRSSRSRSSSRSKRSSSSRSSRSESRHHRKDKKRKKRRKSSPREKKKPPAKPAANMWKKNTFTNVDDAANGGDNVENGKVANTGEKEKGSEDGMTLSEEMKNKEARRKARKEFRKRPWINIPVPDVPEESMIRRVFELFGRVRKIEVPLLKEEQDKNSKYKKRSNNSRGIGVFNFETFAAQSEAANVTSFKTFSVYIQYETYLGFTVAMNALRGKRLYYKDLDDRAYLCTFKVDFDGTGYLSDRKIKQRKVERFKMLHKDEIENDEYKEPSSRKDKEKNRHGSSRKKSSINSKGVYASETSSRVAETREKDREREKDKDRDREKEEKEKSKSHRAFRGAEYFNEDGSQVSRKRKSLSRYEPNALRRKRDKIAFPMPDSQILPKSILHEKSESHARTRTIKSLSFVGPELPKDKSADKDRGRDVESRSKDLSHLTDVSDISSEEEEEREENGLASNTEIDRLLKEALKVKNGRKRRLVVLELLRRLQAAKESRVYLVAKRKAQAVILVHAIFERIKDAENVIMQRHVEMLEQVRRKQIEHEKSLKEELARKEALNALRQYQKMQSKEVKLREKMVKRVMRCKDKEDLERREKLRRQVAAATAAAQEGDEDAETNPLVIKSTALREARHSVRRHGFKPDMVGHLEDKAVGYTAPENYSNYVEYMKEKRPNFVGSAVVTNFTAEETPMRADVVRSCVVPKQSPVPAPLEEIIKTKQFETDSESSCDEVEPPPPPVPVAEPRKISYARTHLAFIKPGGLGGKKEKRTQKISTGESAQIQDAQVENDSEGFKVPQLPAGYRDGNDEQEIEASVLDEKVESGKDKLGSKRADNYNALSSSGESSDSDSESGSGSDDEKENGAEKSATANQSEENVDGNKINDINGYNPNSEVELADAVKPREKANDLPQKRRNAVEESIMGDVDKMGYNLTPVIDAGRSTDTQTLSGLESQSDNDEGTSEFKKASRKKRNLRTRELSKGQHSDSSGSDESSSSASEEGEVSEDDSHSESGSPNSGHRERKDSGRVEHPQTDATSEQMSEVPAHDPQLMTNIQEDQTEQSKDPEKSEPSSVDAKIANDVPASDAIQEREMSATGVEDNANQNGEHVDEKSQNQERETDDASSASGSGDESYYSSSSESGSLSESEGEVDE